MVGVGAPSGARQQSPLYRNEISLRMMELAEYVQWFTLIMLLR